MQKNVFQALFIKVYLDFFSIPTENTFEEKIDAMLLKKKDLSDLSIQAGETWIGNLNDTEIRNLFTRG